MGDRARGLPGPGDALDLEVTDLDAGGRGVGRWGEVVVFVPGALPGDRVTALVRRVRAKGAREGGPKRGGFLEADLGRIVTPSPDRVAPPCPVAAKCGGCQLLALSYPAQLEWKTRTVRQVLRRIGGIQEDRVRPCLGAPVPYGYRNKAQFPVSPARGQAGGRDGRNGPDGRNGRDGRNERHGRSEGSRRRRRREGLAAGLFRPGTHEIVPIENCLLQHPVNNRVLAAATRIAGELGVQAYDEDTGRGLLRHVLARVTRDGRSAMAVLVTAGTRFPAGRRFAAALREAVPEVVTVVQNVNTRRTNVILGPRSLVLSGPGYIVDKLAGLSFRISASSFFQVNPDQAELLYRQVVALAGKPRRAVDVYCGVGTITLAAAREIGSLEDILGVDSNREAVRDAAANARANGISKARFVKGDAAVLLRDLAATGEPVDLVVLDPPRKGCEPGVLEALLELGRSGRAGRSARAGCGRLVYVSCNPATLARDLAALAGGGFRVETVQPLDMFPQTTHIECCALLVRAEDPPEGGGAAAPESRGRE